MATTTKHPTIQERIKQEDKNNAMKNAMMMRVLKPKGSGELFSSLGVRRRRPSYVVNFFKIFSSESTRPMETKLGLNHH
jgi:hypothetical protein